MEMKFITKVNKTLNISGTGWISDSSRYNSQFFVLFLNIQTKPSYKMAVFLSCYLLLMQQCFQRQILGDEEELQNNCRQSLIIMFQLMILLLPLILLAAAQQCPYCRWNACTQTIGGLYSCSDCYLGALVNFQLPDPYIHNPVNIGICMFCPAVCLSCQYAAINQTRTPPLIAIKCNECISGNVVSSYDGSCAVCPWQCITCVCGADNCTTTICTQCADGYTLNQTENRCVANQGRLLVGAEAVATEKIKDHFYTSALVWIGISSLLAMLLLGSLRKKRERQLTKLIALETEVQKTVSLQEKSRA